MSFRRRLLLALTPMLLLGITACRGEQDGNSPISGDNDSIAVAPIEDDHAEEADHGDGHGGEIAWFDGDTESAFAAAQAEGKPLFLYWGASWCPPCHYLKTKVFKKPEFVAKSEEFVPVYLDGDTEHAQILGEQLEVKGYPTVIIFSPDGEEVMRMDNGIPVQQYASVLDTASTLMRPMSEVFSEVMEVGPADVDPKMLNALAFYSWGQDARVGLDDESTFETFRRLYEETPEEMALEKSRFLAETMTEAFSVADQAAADAEDDEVPAEEKQAPPFNEEELAAYHSAVDALVADDELSHANSSFIFYWSRESAELFYTEPSAEREAFIDAWLARAEEIENNEEINVDDRVTALYPQLELGRLRRDAPYVEIEDASAVDGGEGEESEEGEADSEEAESESADTEAEGEEEEPEPLPEALTQKVLDRVQWAEETVSDEGELQAVMSTMVWLLQDIERDDEAEALILRKMEDTLAPYYYMSWLAGIKRSNDEAEEAVSWYKRAHEASVGQYTRFRWGSTYLRRLIELQPENVEAIQTDTAAILGELMENEDAFSLGNLSRLNQLGDALMAWNEDGSHDEVVNSLRDMVHAECDRYEGIDSAPLNLAVVEEAVEADDAEAAEGETEEEGAEGEEEAEEEVDTQTSRCYAFLVAEEEEATE